MKRHAHNLLVVDWDYFVKYRDRDATGEPTDELFMFDWSMMETSFFIDHIWSSRASGFIQYDLPLPATTGEEHAFWRRFAFAPGATMFYGDSNALAVNTAVAGPSPAKDFRAVWLFDAHHDAGYRQKTPSDIYALVNAGRWSCEDWMIFYAACGASLHVRYPAWKAYALEYEPGPLIMVDRRVDDGRALDRVVFDRVFVCRSGAWTPPRLDPVFFEFVDRCPIRDRVNLDGVTVREDGLARARYEAEIIKRLSQSD